MKKLTQEEIIKRFIITHNNFYTYEHFIYNGMHYKSWITCPIHGDFLQNASNHLLGRGCPICGRILANKKTTKTTSKFIEEATTIHKNIYNYSLVKYINNYTLVEIICKKCGKHFLQAPCYHLLGQGCPFCAKNIRRDNLENFIKKAQKIHKENYDYSLVKYINNKTPIEIICKKCGKHFWQRPDNHLFQKQGCPFCKESKGEREISIYLIEHDIKFEKEKRFNGIKRKPFDFYIPSLNIALEYNGKQHYKPVEKFGGEEQLKNQQKIDKSKKEYCKKNNINLYIIKYTENIKKRLREIFNL